MLITQTFVRSFHTTVVRKYLPQHPLSQKLDWEKVASGLFAIVDPMDPAGILYVSPKDYTILVRVAISQDSTLVVLARPGEAKPLPSLTKDTIPKTPPIPKFLLKAFRKSGITEVGSMLSTELSDVADPADFKDPSGGFPVNHKVRKLDRMTVLAAEREARRIEAVHPVKYRLHDLILVQPGEQPSTVVSPESSKDPNSAAPQRPSEALARKWRAVPDREFWKFTAKGSSTQDLVAWLAEASRRTGGDTGKTAKPSSRLFSWHLSALRDLAAMPGGDRRKPMVTPSADVLRSLVLRWGLLLNYRLGGPLTPTRSLRKALDCLGAELVNILLTRGAKALVAKMKNTLFFVNAYLSKQGNTNPWLLGEPVGLAKSGLPSILPLVIRRGIANGDIGTIRLVQSLLVAYKAIKAPYEPQDMKTVLGPHPTIDPAALEDFERFCKDVFWGEVVRKNALQHKKLDLLKANLVLPKDSQPYVPLRAGPNNPTGLLGAPQDALAWDCCPVQWPIEWAKHVGDEATVSLFQNTLKFAKEWSKLDPPKEELLTGRLALLEEPAGKLRPIALVDYWTQRVMYPVHRWMMDVLRLLPGDSTFNQDAAVKTFALSAGENTVHSVDLKSATDLIPMALYESLFKGIWGETTTNLWVHLLTDRWFELPDTPNIESRLVGRQIQYGRGQPMGTLSSWASMALVHHALVLYSAYKAGIDPVEYSAYRVLGDDVVLSVDGVADSYIQNCSSLCVPTSPAKTLKGELFIFASQVYWKGISISPMSLLEELGVRSFHQRLEMALRAFSRGWTSDKTTVARFLRLMINRDLYRESLKSWARGKLGRVAQAVLISAFGIAGRALHVLGFQGSQITPFLLALQDKVQAVEGDRNRLEVVESQALKELELLLAVALVTESLKQLQAKVREVKEGAAHWKQWVARFREDGMLPFGVKTKEGVSTLAYYTSTPALVAEYSAIFDVLMSSFGPLFGLEQKRPESFVRYFEDGFDQEEDDPMGFGELGLPAASHPSLVTLLAPALAGKLNGSNSRVLEIQKTLVKGDLSSTEIWDLVDEVFSILSKIPRVPTFEGMASLIPDRSPKAVDSLRSWVRQVKAWDTALRYLPMTVMPYVGGEEGSLALDEQALLDSHSLATPPAKEKQGFTSDRIA